jgi:MarR-like DNA-binding transcriptional regulator SgrR of sgrS sRNA
MAVLIIATSLCWRRGVKPFLLFISISLFVYILMNFMGANRPSNSKDVNIITEVIQTKFDYPDPYRMKFVAPYRFVHQVGEFLVRQTPNGEIVPGLARSWDISEDRREITFHLRSNIYTAEETAQSLRRLIAFGQTSHSSFASQIKCEDVLVIDEETLRIRTKGDAGALLSPLVMSDAVILPDDHWHKQYESEVVDWSKARGPYIHAEGTFPLSPNSHVLYVPNPKHYLFNSDQVAWKILYKPEGTIGSLSDLSRLLSASLGYSTLRFWNRDVRVKESVAIPYLQTQQNGLAYLLINHRYGIFRDRNLRLSFAKAILGAQLPLLEPSSRAHQIAQPGLSGRIQESEERDLLQIIGNAGNRTAPVPIKWRLPSGPNEDKEWLKLVVQASKQPAEFSYGEVWPWSSEWKKGQVDVAFAGVGMSESDPISSATFLFSPNGNDSDFSDYRLLRKLNGVKGSRERELVSQTIRDVFKVALKEGLIVPLHFIASRIYYSDGIELNMDDPFMESPRIWNVRIKPTR